MTNKERHKGFKLPICVSAKDIAVKITQQYKIERALRAIHNKVFF
jgi:hypothetical protein